MHCHSFGVVVAINYYAISTHFGILFVQNFRPGLGTRLQ